eukprot:g8999.t1
MSTHIFKKTPPSSPANHHQSFDSSKYKRYGNTIPDWFQGSPKNIKLNVSPIGNTKRQEKEKLLKQKKICKSIEDMKQFSECVFFSLKNQRVDAKVASGIDAHKVHRVTRVPPREAKRRKKAVKKALNRMKHVSHLEDMIREVKHEWCENIFSCEGGRLWILDKEKEFVESTSFAHPGKKLKIKMGEGTVGIVCLSGVSINVQDAQKHAKHDKNEDSKTNSFLCVKVGDLMGRPLGCLTLHNKLVGGRFTEEDEKTLLRLADALGRNFAHT